MARGRGAKQFFNFVKGWITESSPMTYPENSAKDLSNVILDIDGSIRRRPGIDFEDQRDKFGLALSTTEADSWAFAIYDWVNVGGSASLSFVVTQVGASLYFHRQNGLNTAATSVGSVDLTPFVTDLTKARMERVQVAAGMGYLFVTNRYMDPVRIDYDGATLTATRISIAIRDFDGVDDGLTIEERPTTLSDTHAYNLFNQGWNADRINSFFGGTAVTSSTSTVSLFSGSTLNTAINLFLQAIASSTSTGGTYPSNADIMYLGMKSNSDGDLVFDANELKAQTFGNTPAPKGHFILPAFNQARGDLTGLSGVPNTVIASRPATAAFHNGRVFYAGLEEQGITGNVYFSQQLTDVDKAGNCYQEQDPTAEDFNDLLETDGGLIVIPSCARILKLVESTNGVIVFASNGVWEISGAEGAFSATNISVRRVTHDGCVGAGTVIEAEGQWIYWSDAGIIALSPDEITGRIAATSISNNTIQIGYQLIGGLQRKFATGTYIPEEKKAVWLYSTYTGYDGETQRYRYNGVLILDMVLGAFYKYLISDTANTHPYMAGIAKTQPFASGVVQDLVTVNGATVTVNGADVTVADEGFTGVDFSAWKILTTIDSDTASSVDFTFAEFYSRSFKDWFKTDGLGVDYSSYLETGYELFGNAMVDKQPVYVFTYFSPLSKSLASGSYYELPALVTATLGIRVTQEAKEVEGIYDSNLRVSQSMKEAGGTYDSTLRVTQCVKEVLIG